MIASTDIAKQHHESFEWGSFMNIFLNKYEIHRYNMKQLYRNQKQRILFLSKSEGWHGRAWANNDTKSEIVDYLYDTFHVDIDMKTDAELAKLSLFEQINLALTYTILISPSGAVSFFGAFMAPNTCVIIKDVWGHFQHRSWHLDFQLFNYDHRKCIYYLGTTEDDARFDLPMDKMIAKGQNALHSAYRDAAKFYLHPKKVAYTVYNALNWIEKRMNWQNTYHLPPNWTSYMEFN